MSTSSKAATCGGKSDLVMTPDALASAVVHHFSSQMSGRILEPCCGEGAFLRALAANGFSDVINLELSKGEDFFTFTEPVEWIITNPPWSKARAFALHAYTLANNIVWLINTGIFLDFARV
jgi:hypothetical protein